MLAALAAMPFLIRAIGQERLGVLSLIWVIVGYFSFLDMGLGRAVTVAIACVILTRLQNVKTSFIF